MRSIDVRFGLTRHNEPQVTFVNSPLAFIDVEIRPRQIREIAAALMKIADKSEVSGLNPRELLRSYEVGE